MMLKPSREIPTSTGRVGTLVGGGGLGLIQKKVEKVGTGSVGERARQDGKGTC